MAECTTLIGCGSPAVTRPKISVKYFFNNLGTVKELLFPNKVILQFKLNGKDEKAIAMKKGIYIGKKDGKTV